MNINDLTLGQIKEIQAMCSSTKLQSSSHPMVGRRCLIRTYSAGVHIGDVIAVNEMEVHLKNALRLWKWDGGGKRGQGSTKEYVVSFPCRTSMPISAWRSMMNGQKQFQRLIAIVNIAFTES